MIRPAFLLSGCLFLLFSPSPCEGQSQLIGPAQPIVAILGGHIFLPCHLDPAVDAFDMTVEWMRPDLEDIFVLLWRRGVEFEHKKHPSYEGRTSLSLDKLTHGDVSLKLSEVKLSDKGKYRCFIPSPDRQSIVELVVGAASSPVINMTKSSSGVVLECESKGWYPEPELLWLDAEGKLLSAGAPETVRGPDGLYTVSSRVIVEKSHGNSFTCRVRQNKTRQTRQNRIHVPDSYFPSSPAVPFAIGFSVVFFCFVAVAAFVVWIWRCIKIKRKKENKTNSQGNNTELQCLKEENKTNSQGINIELQCLKEENNTNSQGNNTEHQSLAEDLDKENAELEEEPQKKEERQSDTDSGFSIDGPCYGF